jgi:hypothetical protein
MRIDCPVTLNALCLSCQGIMSHQQTRRCELTEEWELDFDMDLVRGLKRPFVEFSSTIT